MDWNSVKDSAKEVAKSAYGSMEQYAEKIGTYRERASQMSDSMLIKRYKLPTSAAEKFAIGAELKERGIKK